MSELSELIKQRKQNLSSVVVCEVPEWPVNGKPLAIYADPWTVEDDSRMAAKLGRDEDWTVDVVIRKARGEDGNLLFTLEDKPLLKRDAERHVLVRIAHAIMFSMSLDDAKKNSEMTEES